MSPDEPGVGIGAGLVGSEEVGEARELGEVKAVAFPAAAEKGRRGRREERVAEEEEDCEYKDH